MWRMFRVHRLRVPVAGVFIVIGVAACSADGARKGDALDARLAGPCDRLVVGWSIERQPLSEIVGPEFTLRVANGAGQLRLSVMRCGASPMRRSRQAPLVFAYLKIPVAADSTPLVITNVADDGWFATPVVVADVVSSPIFAKLAYDVVEAGIVVDVHDTGRTKSVAVRLQFDTGRISIDATVQGSPSAYDDANALVHRGSSHLSAFFGQETAQRYSAVAATVQIEGDTPLSDLTLSATPDVAMFDTALQPDRVYWRMPNESGWKAAK